MEWNEIPLNISFLKEAQILNFLSREHQKDTQRKQALLQFPAATQELAMWK